MDGDMLFRPVGPGIQGGSSQGLQFFIDFINVLEGAKSKIKNLHWAAKNLSNSDKRGTHLYLDDFLEVVGDFQDRIAEASSGVLGEMGLNVISGVHFDCITPRDLIEDLLVKTKAFYTSLPEGIDYVGIKSETEVFILDLDKYKYLFRLTE